jgi:hypothetical protein
MMRRAGWLVSLVLAVSLAACIDGDAGGDSGDTGNGGNGVPGPGPGPDNGDNGNEAPASPLDIPRITIAQGRPVEEVEAELAADLAQQCGGTLCVTLRREPGDSDTLTACQFDTTDPAPGEQVERGGVVIVVTGSSPCAAPTITTSP